MKRILFSLFLFLASIVVFADGGFTVADVFYGSYGIAA